MEKNNGPKVHKGCGIFFFPMFRCNLLLWEEVGWVQWEWKKA